MQVTLNFGGFYGSHHEALIDDMVEMFMRDNSCNMPEDFDCDCVDYKSLHDAYCRKYVDFINDTLKTKITFVSVDSPKFYNFATDVILCDVSETDAKKIIRRADKESLKQRIKEISTSCDGYMAFFNYDEIMKDIPLKTECAFDVLISDDILVFEEWLEYYDLNSVHEIVFWNDYIKYNGLYEINEDGEWVIKQ